MSPLFNQSLAVFGALLLTLSSIGAIVTVPPAHAAPAFPASIELA
ncbi:hypothetical protein [Erythrobacter sp. MTPC3]